MQHWRYLVARYGAYPVVWCIAGEVDLPVRHDAPLADQVPPSEQVAIWEDASRLVARTDPFRRVRTVHPCPAFTYASSEVFSSSELFDLDMLQTGHVVRNSVPRTMQHLRRAVERASAPVVNGECNYEGIFDSNWQDMQRFLFWSHMLSGAAGHTYGTMAISTFNAKDDPSEPLSRVSIHYWEDAINWLGAAHVGVGRASWRRSRGGSYACPQRFDLTPVQTTGSYLMPPICLVARSWFMCPGYVCRAAPPKWRASNNSVPRCRTGMRLARVAINMLDQDRYRGTFVNPRKRGPDSSFVLEPTDGQYILQSERWVTPTGEDWVLLIEPM